MSDNERQTVLPAVSPGSVPGAEEEKDQVKGGELVFRATDPSLLRYSDEGEGPPVIEGRMMPYDEWTEIRSSVEGHFMERFAPGSLVKTMTEQASKMRALFEHGLDAVLGRQAIAEINELREEEDGAWYRATVLEGLPPLLISGLKRGLYGSSVRFKPEKMDRVRYPERSEHNPTGIEERTVREASVKEISVVTFPQYAGATAHVRSLTDEFAARQLLGDPTLLLDMLRSATNVEPPHSEGDPEPEPAPEPEPEPEPEQSRRTQPVHDYLTVEEEDQWRL